MRKSNKTVGVIFFTFFIIFCVIVGNVFLVSIVGIHINSGVDISNYSNNITTYKQTLQARRGFIYDTNKEIIAQDTTTYNIYAVIDENRQALPGTIAYVADKETTAAALAPLLSMSEAECLAYLTSNPDAYQVEFGSKGRNLSQLTKDRIDELNLPGIEFTENSGRIYPSGTFASHLVGFAQYDAGKGKVTGRTGIELAYNEYLTGTNGYIEYQTNNEGIKLPGTQVISQASENGNDIYLTIDSNIQSYLENGLNETMTSFECEQAWGVIMEVKTGRILAYAAYPTYDLNKKDIVSYVDVPIGYAFEPGSTMKPFLIAAAIDTGVYKGNTAFKSGLYHAALKNGTFTRLNTKGGSGYVGTIQDFNQGKGWGTITYDEALIRSSNTGMVDLFVTQNMSATWRDYLTKFGFLQSINFDVPGEVNGSINYDYGIEKLTTTFGQGISINTIQLLQAYTALFNGGQMVKPYVISEIRDSYDDSILYQAKTEVLGYPISESTADRVLDLMTEVIENSEYGSGRFYKIPEVEMAGKTGTAEISGDGSYIEGEGQNLYSIVAAAPADDPEVMIFYAIKQPSTKSVHDNTTIFKQIFRSTLQYLGIHDQNEYDSNTKDEVAIYQEYMIDNYTNTLTEVAYEELSEQGYEVVVIGEGNDVISQYPAGNTNVFTSQRVFLYTGNSKIEMPDMTGWSRKDAIAFWSLTNIALSSSGEGYVIEQNIPAGEIIDENDTIQLLFSLSEKNEEIE
ncbi:MAG: penicillin-binding protein [Erysipelotrichaceae bacterium]|nr:penicillin-binding protein [Erysipelotrichaceae bacterium]